MSTIKAFKLGKVKNLTEKEVKELLGQWDIYGTVLNDVLEQEDLKIESINGKIINFKKGALTLKRSIALVSSFELKELTDEKKNSEKTLKSKKSFEQLNSIAKFAFDNYADKKVEFINSKTGELVKGIVQKITIEKESSIVLHIKNSLTEKLNFISLSRCEIKTNLRVTGDAEDKKCVLPEISKPNLKNELEKLIRVFSNELTEEQKNILSNL